MQPSRVLQLEGVEQMAVCRRRYKAKTYTGLEEIVNKALDLRSTKGSGAVAGDGDGKGRDRELPTYCLLLAECKFKESEKKTLAVNKKDFEKTEKAAIRFGRIPAMFTSDLLGDIYAILLLEDFEFIYKNHLNYMRLTNDDRN